MITAAITVDELVPPLINCELSFLHYVLKLLKLLSVKTVC